MQYRKEIKTFLVRAGLWLGALVVLLILGAVIYRIPAVEKRLSWRVDIAYTTLRTLLFPIGAVPTAVLSEPQVKVATLTPSTGPAYPTPQAQQSIPPTVTAAPSPTPTEAPLPPSVTLPAPKYERQDWNSCGPAALAMALHFYGWEGSQEDINQVIKPLRADRNVNIDELSSFIHTQVPNLRAEYRVGGDINLLHRLLAGGFPVVVEETFFLNEKYWVNDDLWAGHYQLVTGYDDNAQTFTAQDTFVSPNRKMTFLELDRDWQAFNRAYLLVYPPEEEEKLKEILKDDWDVESNRRRALEVAQAETEKTPNNAFSWFNLGTNLVYFKRYTEAGEAYDKARQLGLPQRMLRYQFGPFLAYFHGGRIDDLMALVDYALKTTPNSEEALLWKGWALYRQGKRDESGNLFKKALEARPGYSDAIYALNFLQSN